MNRKCCRCHEIKPLTDFHKDRNSPCGRRYYCKECARLYKKEYYKKNKATIKKKASDSYYTNIERYRERNSVRAKAYYKQNRCDILKKQRDKYRADDEYRSKKKAQNRIWVQGNWAAVTRKTRSFRKNHPDKYKAYTAVKNAVRGGVLPPIKTRVCVNCGKQANEYHHHHGYDDDHVLDVVPLCYGCHKGLDKIT